MQKTVAILLLLCVTIAAGGHVRAQYCTTGLYESGTYRGCNPNSPSNGGVVIGRIDDFVLYGQGTSKIEDTATGCGNGGSGTISATSYSDRTFLPPVSLERGDTAAGRIRQFNSASAGGQYTFTRMRIWVDFNDDFVFDSTERLITHNTSLDSRGHLVLPSQNTQTATLPFFAVIPPGSPLGIHQLRVRSATGYSPDAPLPYGDLRPCDRWTYGEAHDSASTFWLPRVCMAPRRGRMPSRYIPCQRLRCCMCRYLVLKCSSLPSPML